MDVWLARRTEGHIPFPLVIDEAQPERVAYVLWVIVLQEGKRRPSSLTKALDVPSVHVLGLLRAQNHTAALIKPLLVVVHPAACSPERKVHIHDVPRTPTDNTCMPGDVFQKAVHL